LPGFRSVSVEFCENVISISPTASAILEPPLRLRSRADFLSKNFFRMVLSPKSDRCLLHLFTLDLPKDGLRPIHLRILRAVFGRNLVDVAGF